MHTHPSRLRQFAAALFLLALGACASMAPRESLRVHVAGLEPLPGEGLEVRFKMKLRLQNPNETPIDYDGVAVDLELNGRPFAAGVSSERGTVPRFGETVIGVPVTVSALDAVRQAFGLVGSATLENLPYVLRARVAGGSFGVATVSEAGTLSLPGVASPPAGIR